MSHAWPPATLTAATTRPRRRVRLLRPAPNITASSLAMSQNTEVSWWAHEFLVIHATSL
jgi:hypothetical protein